MKIETLLIIFVVAGFVYLTGYITYAYWIVILGVIFFIISGLSAKRKPKRVAVPRGEVLEPIVIESTRGAPYRIPKDMEIWMKPEAGVPRPWWAKVTSKGPIAYFGKKLGQFLGGGEKEEKEEKKEEK